MTSARRFELEDMLIRPGTYFNPQTEVLVVVDDSPEIDREIFDMEELEGAEWVLISDESPLDEALRDELLERFQAAGHASGRAIQSGLDGEEEDEDDEEEDEDEEDELDGDLRAGEEEIGRE